METPTRIIITDDNDDGKGIKKALQLLSDLTKKDNTLKKCILYIPVKGSLKDTTLSQALGESWTKVLDSNKAVQLGNCCLQLETIRSLKSYTGGDGIIAVYADQKMMDSIDSNRKFKVIISVPHSPDAVNEWKRTWNPLSPNGKTENKTLIINPIVEAALKTLTNSINLSNRALNPRDRDATKDIFRILRANNQYEDLDNIRAWCIKNEWDSKGADEAVKHAAKAFSLKSKPKPLGNHWASNIYQQWIKSTK